MTYRVVLSSRAMKQGDRLSREIKSRIIRALKRLAKNPYPPGVQKLEGSSYYRLRVGDYRVIYEVQRQQLVVLVIRIGHRRDVYR